MLEHQKSNWNNWNRNARPLMFHLKKLYINEIRY